MADIAPPAACAACTVRDRALCSALSADELALLNRHARERRLRRGETLFPVGDDSLCGNLIEGLLKVVSRDIEGREQIVGLLFPGDFVGRLAGAERHETVALTPSRLCLFPRRELAAALDRNPAMERLLLERTTRSMDEARERLHLLLRGSADSRVEGLLHELAARAGASAFDLPLSRGDMADALGLTLETVSRVLGRLKAAGRLETSGRRAVRLLPTTARGHAG
jgi:CRP/FNR family transcriptional regulator